MKDKIIDFYNKLDKINQVLFLTMGIIAIILVVWPIAIGIIKYVKPSIIKTPFKKVESLRLLEKRKDATIFEKVKYNKTLSELSNGEYSFSCWLYIKKWFDTDKLKKWKHVFHVGSKVYNNSQPMEINWESISTQTPGLWLFPDVNNARLVFTTERKNPYMNRKIKELEYCDISNIDIKSWCNITFTLSYNLLDVYYNGKLVKTQVLKGIPVINKKNNLFINYNNGYDGFIQKLEIIPKKINPDVANKIYQSGYQTLISSGIFSQISGLLCSFS